MAMKTIEDYGGGSRTTSTSSAKKVNNNTNTKVTTSPTKTVTTTASKTPTSTSVSKATTSTSTPKATTSASTTKTTATADYTPVNTSAGKKVDYSYNPSLDLYEESYGETLANELKNIASTNNNASSTIPQTNTTNTSAVTPNVGGSSYNTNTNAIQKVDFIPEVSMGNAPATDVANTNISALDTYLNEENKKKEYVEEEVKDPVVPATPKTNVQTVLEETGENTGYDYTALIEVLQRIQQEKYDALEKALLSNKQKADDEANANYARNLREWKRTYGNGLNGQGLSNKFALMSNRDETLRSNQADYDTNKANALSGKFDDYMDIAKNLNGLDSESLKKILGSI